jgi:drug/metabolite transporter (DMT)-like permease
VPVSNNIRAYLLLGVTTLSFGMNANFGKLAVGEVSPMLLVTLRWVGTLTLVLLIARSRFIADWPVLRRHWRFLIAMGMLGLTAFNGLFYVAAYTTTALNIGIIQGSIPVFVLVGSYLLFRTRIRSLQVVGIAVTLIGVIIVTINGDINRLLALTFQHGDVLMIIACMLYAGYSVGLQKCPDTDRMSLFTMFAIGALLASVPLTISESLLGTLQWPTTKGWIIVLLVTLFPSFLAQICFIKAVDIIGASRAGIFFNLIPIFAAIIAVMFLGERFVLYHAIALALVLCGIGIAEWGKRHEL